MANHFAIDAWFGVLCVIFAIGLVIAAFAFWIWMLIDCLTNEPSEGNDKIIWTVVMVFLHFLGALLYFFARRPMRIQTYGK